jgi:hypothetical protein
LGIRVDVSNQPLRGQTFHNQLRVALQCCPQNGASIVLAVVISVAAIIVIVVVAIVV